MAGEGEVHHQLQKHRIPWLVFPEWGYLYNRTISWPSEGTCLLVRREEGVTLQVHPADLDWVCLLCSLFWFTADGWCNLSANCSAIYFACSQEGANWLEDIGVMSILPWSQSLLLHLNLGYSSLKSSHIWQATPISWDEKARSRHISQCSILGGHGCLASPSRRTALQTCQPSVCSQTSGPNSLAHCSSALHGGTVCLPFHVPSCSAFPLWISCSMSPVCWMTWMF